MMTVDLLDATIQTILSQRKEIKTLNHICLFGQKTTTASSH